MMENQQKEYTNSILDAFDSLKSPKIDEKLTGGARIISQLQKNKNDKDVTYTLKRLVRSLGANVPDMRMGYFATLVKLLSSFENITISDVLDSIKKELHANKSSKSEIGDVSLGQILVYGAIFRSRLFFKGTAEEQRDIIQNVLTASNKKSYLSTVAYLILLDLVNGLDDENFPSVWPILKPEMKKEVKEHSLDSLYFLLMVNYKFPEQVKLRKLIGANDMFHEELIPEICEKLMTGIDFNSSNHPIYSEIGKGIAKSPHLLLFWEKIDSYLVKHNRNRELAAINILNTILLNIQDNEQVLPDLLSENFFKLTMDWFKGLQTASRVRRVREQEDDHKIMLKKEKEFLTSLSKALKLPTVDSKIRVAVLKKLLFNPGEIYFTEITGSTVVKSIVADLDADGLKTLVKMLKKVLLNSSKKTIKENVARSWYNNERVKAAELISYIVSHEAVKDDTEFKISYMQLLMCFGFFKIGGDENVAVSNELSGSIKTCFYRCFTSRFSNVDNLVTVLSSLTNFIAKIMEKPQVLSKLEKQFTKETMECWQLHTKVCQKINKVETKSKVENVFLILLHQLGLFLFSEPAHIKMAQGSIIELKSCYDHFRKEKKKKKNHEEKSTSEDEPQWIEVMIEVLLSILSIDSSVLRSAVQCVFRLLWEYLTPSSMEQIVSVLDPDSEVNPLEYDSDSESEEEDENKTKSDEDEENKEDNEEDSDTGMDSDEENLKTPDQLRLAVQKALANAAAPDTDAESIDADMITEEDGKKLDEALSEVFKQYRPGKKSKKDRKNKKALSDFRIRVLDLIDIYLEKDPAMDICLSMIPPLTRCLESCLQDNQLNELANKIRKTFKSLLKVRKFSSIGKVTLEILGDFFNETIEKHDRSHFMYQSLGDVITYCAIFIINCSRKIESEQSNHKSPKLEQKKIKDSLRAAMRSYFNSRNSTLPIIFFHRMLLINWEGSIHILYVILDHIFDNNIRHFRRNEGVELIISFYRTLHRKDKFDRVTYSHLVHFEKEFKNRLTKALREPPILAVKPNFVKTLKKLVHIIKLYHDSNNIPTFLDIKSILDTISNAKVLKKPKNKNTDAELQDSAIPDAKSVKKQKKRKRNLEQDSDENSEDYENLLPPKQPFVFH